MPKIGEILGVNACSELGDSATLKLRAKLIEGERNGDAHAPAWETLA
jgi:hypothetical protein